EPHRNLPRPQIEPSVRGQTPQRHAGYCSGTICPPAPDQCMRTPQKLTKATDRTKRQRANSSAPRRLLQRYNLPTSTRSMYANPTETYQGHRSNQASEGKLLSATQAAAAVQSAHQHQINVCEPHRNLPRPQIEPSVRGQTPQRHAGYCSGTICQLAPDQCMRTPQKLTKATDRTKRQRANSSAPRRLLQRYNLPTSTRSMHANPTETYQGHRSNQASEGKLLSATQATAAVQSANQHQINACEPHRNLPRPQIEPSVRGQTPQPHAGYCSGTICQPAPDQCMRTPQKLTKATDRT